MSLPEHHKKSFEDMFCFICSEKCIKIISSYKLCGLFRFAFKKIIPNNTTTTFQKVGGVTRPLILCLWYKNFSWYRVNHHQND